MVEVPSAIKEVTEPDTDDDEDDDEADRQTQDTIMDLDKLSVMAASSTRTASRLQPVVKRAPKV